MLCVYYSSCVNVHYFCHYYRSQCNKTHQLIVLPYPNNRAISGAELHKLCYERVLLPTAISADYYRRQNDLGDVLGHLHKAVDAGSIDNFYRIRDLHSKFLASNSD